MPPLALSSDDLAPFADLGTSVETEGHRFVLVRNGSKIEVELNDTGYTISNAEGHVRRLSDAWSVLADPAFADLQRIARNQTVMLTPQRIRGRPVPISTQLNRVVGEVPKYGSDQKPWEELDNWLREQHRSRNQNGTDILLIDGPAGVGKTTIVREAAILRAENYDGSLPLILQIASRGRVLQNIADLIAFALQDIRTNLTINQLITLVRHGLVVLAIDGFDELSDPNGFETAWSGLNNVVRGSRGAATFLLAGRETFVSPDLILRQLQSFDDTRDRLAALNIGDPTPTEARYWLLDQQGWSTELLAKDFVEPIFVEGSYALRPFFLDVIAREPTALAGDTPPASDLLSYLVDVMTKREAEKFVETLDPPNGNESEALYREYVVRFLEEVARDLAENQSEAIADDALDLLATVAADGLLPADQVSAVVQRSRSVVFLSNDLRVGYVRFGHEQLLQHFLAREALRSVGNGETPRYIRRNLFGRESLDVFAHVARGRESATDSFLAAVRTALQRPSRDRTNTNLAVLGVSAACAIAVDDANLQIRGIGINELHFPFAAPSGIDFRDASISILYASGADIRKVHFGEGVHIYTLEIDRRTSLPNTLPMPTMVVQPSGETRSPADIEAIIRPSSVSPSVSSLEWPENIGELLGRIDRYRTFWLRTNINDTDQQGRRIVAHPDWPRVFDALRELDLVTVKSRQASGTRSDFVHFRQDTLLSEHLDLHRALVQ